MRLVLAVIFTPILIGFSPEPGMLDPATVLRRADKSIDRAMDHYPYTPIWSMADGAVEKLKAGPEFRGLAGQIESSLRKEEWQNLTAISTRMYALLPAKLPTTYPFDEDTRAQWLAGIGAFELYHAHFSQAESFYLQAMKQPAPSTNFRMGAGRMMAAYGLSRVYALTGKTADALKWRALAPTMFRSGCGNCSDGEEANNHRFKAVLAASQLPLPQRETELLKIVDGSFKPVPSELNNNDELQVTWARIEAALMLGESYRLRGEKALATKCYALVSKGDGFNELGCIARTRLKQLTMPIKAK